MFDALWRSFFSKKLYDDVIAYWEGIGFGYLFFLSLVVSGIFTFFYHVELGKAVDEYLPGIVKQFEEVTIEDGVASTKGNKSFVVELKDLDRPLLAVDPTGKVVFDEGKQPMVLVGKEQMLFRPERGVQEVHSLEDVDYLRVGKKDVQELGENIRSYAFVVILPVLLLYSYVKLIIIALMYSFVASFIQKVLRVYIGYVECLRLACVAITPAMIISTISAILYPDYSLLNLIIYVGLPVFYIHLGLRTYKANVEGL